MSQAPFTKRFVWAVTDSLNAIDEAPLNDIIVGLSNVRNRDGRVFVIGNGGGAGHASHAVADFRTLCNIEAYCPSDNSANLTALANDIGWCNAYAAWLGASRIRDRDALLVISVGGGDAERAVSTNIVDAVDLADSLGVPIYGIVGRDGGYTAKKAAACVVIPCGVDEWTTSVVEGLQSVVLHLIVTDPRLKIAKTKWEQEGETKA